MVRRPRQAIVESAGVDFRPCLVSTLFDDGRFVVARLAQRAVECKSLCHQLVWFPSDFEYGLVDPVLWFETAWMGVRRNHCAVDFDRCLDDSLSTVFEGRDVVAGPLSLLGDVRELSEFHDLAVERLTRG